VILRADADSAEDGLRVEVPGFPPVVVRLTAVNLIRDSAESAAGVPLVGLLKEASRRRWLVGAATGDR
jgi:hypothetical protein